MTLLHCESFQNVNSATDLGEKGYTYYNGAYLSFPPTDGRRGGKALQISNSLGYEWVSKGLAASVATVIVGFAFKASGSAGVSSQLLALGNSGETSPHLLISNMPDGSLRVDRQYDGNTIGTSAAAIAPGVWNFIEVKSLCDDAAGTVEIRVNGTSVLSLSGIDTRYGSTVPAGFTYMRISGISNSYNVWFNDWYIADTSGSYNNDFLGDVRVDYYPASANGTTNNFTTLVGAASHWAAVSETTPDHDTSYVESATAAQQELVTCTAMTHNPATIKAVKGYVLARKDDAGARSHKAICRSGGTTYAGATVGLGTSYGGFHDIRERDPNGSIAWTQSNVNAAQFGTENV